jgi:hypothetical protein
LKKNGYDGLDMQRECQEADCYGKFYNGKTQREMDRWRKTEHDKPWTDRRGY